MSGTLAAAAVLIAATLVLTALVGQIRASTARMTSGPRPVMVVAVVLLGGAALFRVVADTTQTDMVFAPRAETLLVLSALVLVAYALYTRPFGRPTSVGTPEEGTVDALTGVASHRTFQDRLVHECDRAYRFGDSFALLLLDLDQFRLTNERYRHTTGDQVLKGLATRLRTQVREIDLCARFGGDQFAIILPHTYETGGVEAAERLRQNIGAWTYLLRDGTEVRVTASAGLAFFPDDGSDPAALVRAAQHALSFAKTLGGNQVQLFRDVPPPGRSLDNVVPLPTTGHGTIVRSLAAAVDVRDRYTHSHSRLVSELAAAVARKMGLKGPEVSQVAVGGLLHDVGKIGIPDAVLTKEGTLTAEEWQCIRQHPVLGTAIIEHAPELKGVIPLVLHHQERFDGTGYPAHLAGESIPMGARIIAAADAYHAIRSDRPYRSGRNHSEALQEIGRCSGSQFDPRVVTALMSVLEADPDMQGLFSSLDAGTTSPGSAVAQESAGSSASVPGTAPDVLSAY
jgi:diguanylate cyclase (GGDEF)-like protein